jgi:peptide/nickel transport system permease protein
VNNLAKDYYSTGLHCKIRKQYSITGYIFSKVLTTLIALLLVSFFVFNIFNPPYHTDFYYGNEQQTLTEIKKLEKEWHLTDPLIVRYGRWLVNMVKGEWGDSFFPPNFYK